MPERTAVSPARATVVVSDLPRSDSLSMLQAGFGVLRGDVNHEEYERILRKCRVDYVAVRRELQRAQASAVFARRWARLRRSLWRMG